MPDSLASVVAAGPPISVVFTVWLSMMAALGLLCRPALCRTLVRRAFWIASHVPSRRHCR